MDLGALDLANGAATVLVRDVPVEPLVLAGQRHDVVPPAPVVRLTISRSVSGWLMVAEAGCRVEGPCWRCLAPAAVDVRVRARELQAVGRRGAAFDEDHDSPYVEREVLDVAGWLRDLVADALPPVVTCHAGCLGLCPRCGADRNADPCGCGGDGRPAVGPFGGLRERLAGDGG